jgi:uncharacterized membrane protein|tara:strand:- start:2051 stop:2446 length:396 start_codon:yes stop_codon:yes gene_type:complete
MKLKKDHIFFAIFLICLLSSLILSMDNPAFCEVLGGCDQVKNSPYSYTFGLKNNFYGVVIFGFLSILTALNLMKPSKDKTNVISVGIILGAAIAIYFLYLQKFVIGAFCKYCMIIDISLIIGLIVLFYMKR